MRPLCSLANKSGDSPASRIQSDDAEQRERQHDERRAALTGAVGPGDGDSRKAEENHSGEEESAGRGQAEPVAEPVPIATGSLHG